MIDDNEGLKWLVRALGAFIGVIASLIMVAPVGTRNGLYRVLVGVTMGTVFAPVAGALPFMGWLDGDTLEHVLARSAAVGFAIWFLLEAIARLLSSTEWLVGLAREVLRLSKREGE